MATHSHIYGGCIVDMHPSDLKSCQPDGWMADVRRSDDSSPNPVTRGPFSSIKEAILAAKEWDKEVADNLLKKLDEQSPTSGEPNSTVNLTADEAMARAKAELAAESVASLTADEAKARADKDVSIEENRLVDTK